MVPLSHSEQVVSMFHQPLHLGWPQNVEFTPRPRSGRSGASPLHQLQHRFHCRASPAQHTQEKCRGGRDEQTFLPVQINSRALRKVPGRGGSQTGHREPPLARSPCVLQIDRANTWTVIAGTGYSFTC